MTDTMEQARETLDTALKEIHEEGLGRGIAQFYELAAVRALSAQAARIAELEAAVRPFAEAVDAFGGLGVEEDHICAWEHPVAINITLGDLRRAASVLSLYREGGAAFRRMTPG